MPVQKWCRQEREVIAQFQRPQFQFEFTEITDRCPQRAILRILALQRVVAYQIQMQMVETGEVMRIEHHFVDDPVARVRTQ